MVKINSLLKMPEGYQFAEVQHTYNNTTINKICKVDKMYTGNKNAIAFMVVSKIANTIYKTPPPVYKEPIPPFFLKGCSY